MQLSYCFEILTWATRRASPRASRLAITCKPVFIVFVINTQVVGYNMSLLPAPYQPCVFTHPSLSRHTVVLHQQGSCVFRKFERY